MIEHNCTCEQCKKVRTLEEAREANIKGNILYRLNEAKEVMQNAGMIREAAICDILHEAIQTNNITALSAIIKAGTVTLLNQQISRN